MHASPTTAARAHHDRRTYQVLSIAVWATAALVFGAAIRSAHASGGIALVAVAMVAVPALAGLAELALFRRFTPEADDRG